MKAPGDSITRAKEVEKAFQQDIALPNFLANVIVHEFEGLLFSAPDAFADWFDEPGVVAELTEIRRGFDSPEHINEGRETAPSKRILAVCDTYDKIAHGSLIALDIGLDAIRQECPLFDAWVGQVEALGARGGA
jgi:hypothetical protein